MTKHRQREVERVIDGKLVIVPAAYAHLLEEKPDESERKPLRRPATRAERMRGQWQAASPDPGESDG